MGMNGLQVLLNNACLPKEQRKASDKEELELCALRNFDVKCVLSRHPATDARVVDQIVAHAFNEQGKQPFAVRSWPDAGKLESFGSQAPERTCNDAERFYPLLRLVYNEHCMGEEQSCFLMFQDRAECLDALVALGRWFLGCEPEVCTNSGEISNAQGQADKESCGTLWAAVNLVGFTL